MNIHHLLLLLCITATLRAEPAPPLQLDGLDILVVGDGNHSSVAIGAPASEDSQAKPIRCAKIRRIIVGDQASLQLSLPKDFEKHCLEKR